MGKDTLKATHVDKCVKCGILFDPNKFTWRSDTQTWRTSCHQCTSSSAKASEYKSKKREHDEDTFKEQHEYLKK